MHHLNTTEGRALARQLARAGKGDPAWVTAAAAAGIGLGTGIASRQLAVLDANGYLTAAHAAAPLAVPAVASPVMLTAAPVTTSSTAGPVTIPAPAGRQPVAYADALARVKRWAPIGLSPEHVEVLAGIAQLRTPEPVPGSFFPALSLWAAVAASQLAADPFAEPLLLIGDPGLGKSAGIINLASVLGIPLQRLPFGVKLSPADVFGEETLLSGSVVARPGKLPVAMLDGSWILFDEIASAPEGTLAHFFEVLEPGGVLSMPWADYVPQPGFRAFSTDNSAGTDLSGRMTHSRSCSPALLSRHQGITLPRPDVVDWHAILPGTTGCEPAWADWIGDFSKAIWTLWDKGELSQSWGIREAQRLVRLVINGGLQPLAACDQAFGFKLSARERKLVAELAQRSLPAVWPVPALVTDDLSAPAGDVAAVFHQPFQLTGDSMTNLGFSLAGLVSALAHRSITDAREQNELGAHWDPSKDVVFVPAQELLDKAGIPAVVGRGFVDHESAHARFTSRTFRKPQGLRGEVYNVLEDWRIEYLASARPGTAANLYGLNRWAMLDQAETAREALGMMGQLEGRDLDVPASALVFMGVLVYRTPGTLLAFPEPIRASKAFAAGFNWAKDHKRKVEKSKDVAGLARLVSDLEALILSLEPEPIVPPPPPGQPEPGQGQPGEPDDSDSQDDSDDSDSQGQGDTQGQGQDDRDDQDDSDSQDGQPGRQDGPSGGDSDGDDSDDQDGDSDDQDDSQGQQGDDSQGASQGQGQGAGTGQGQPMTDSEARQLARLAQELADKLGADPAAQVRQQAESKVNDRRPLGINDKPKPPTTADRKREHETAKSFADTERLNSDPWVQGRFEASKYLENVDQYAEKNLLTAAQLADLAGPCEDYLHNPRPLEADAELGRRLAQELRHAFRSFEDSITDESRRSGRFDSHRASRLAVDDDQVFTRAGEQGEATTGLAVLLDCSGSMGGDKNEATKAALAGLTFALRNNEFLHWGAIQCDGEATISRQMGPCRPVPVFYRPPQGGTNLTVGALVAGRMLARYRRRILVIMSDGDDCYMSGLRRTLSGLSAAGVEVYGVGLDHTAIFQLIPADRACYIGSLAFPEVFPRMIGELVKRGMK